ncbi:MAG: spore coat protein CotJB [Lachnospiraceae bacterium]|nr:spore coat protein CotJB [Lachnospiraceae bacterium]
MNRNTSTYGNNSRTPRVRYNRQGDLTQEKCDLPCTAGIAAESRESVMSEIPAGEQQLLIYLDEVSFCAYDLMLYLDSHPEDENALEAFHKYSKLRKKALEKYERAFGPLRFSQIDEYDMGSFKWVNQPWPWEGGEC